MRLWSRGGGAKKAAQNLDGATYWLMTLSEFHLQEDGSNLTEKACPEPAERAQGRKVGHYSWKACLPSAGWQPSLWYNGLQ